MRKFLIIFLLFILSSPIFSANVKRYSDWEKGFSGYAGAEYVGTTKTIDPKTYSLQCGYRILNSGMTILRYCDKLSKQEIFLLWAALDQYDFSNGEIYTVYILQNNEILQLIVVIKEDGKSVNKINGYERLSSSELLKQNGRTIDKIEGFFVRSPSQ